MCTTPCPTSGAGGPLSFDPSLVDVVLSHTTPLRYDPLECFLPGIDQSKVEKRTEEWLGTIETKLKYLHWYCGHYHIEKDIDRLSILFESIREFRV